MSIESQFKNLLRDIEPSDTTTSQASSAHTQLRNYLKDHLTYSKIYKGSFLGGSWGRDTAIRPKTENGVVSKPDVDIIIEVDYQKTDDPREVLKELRRVLAETYEIDKESHKRSVGVVTSAVDMDIVPIISPRNEPGLFYLPDKESNEWKRSDPGKHLTWSTSINKLTDGRFKPLVKLVKWWRRESPTPFKRPKGFFLERVVADCMDRSESRYSELVVGTLEAIVKQYEFQVSLGMVPHIEDPAVPGNSVASNLTVETFASFLRKAKDHAALGREALAESDSAKALTKWRTIFGDRFPRPTESATRSLLEAPAPAGAYTFPDRPIRLRKPGGFA